MKIGEVFKHYVKSLSSLYDEGEAEAITHFVFEEIVGINKSQFALHVEESMSDVKANDLAWKLMRLQKGEPVQYVLGYTHFYKMKLKVNKSVLIPRPETEELVEWIISNNHEKQNLKIFDIGTGSGCIAIALKRNIPHAEVSAMDISADALKIANENALQNNATIDFYQDDILNPKSEIRNPKFNIIVSNPPYVLSSEKEKLHKNVVAFEPHDSLFVSADDPMVFYKAIIRFAKEQLSNHGTLYFEINESFSSEVAELLHKSGFANTFIKKDISGKDRIIKASG